MFKKTMTFDDLDGNEVTETFYFNYNKKEIAELLEFKQLEEKIARLTVPVEESGLSQVENNRQAYDIFQDLILDAYGQKGPDNVTFIKNEELREYFRNHVAFVELIFEFLGDPKQAADFIEKCLPPKLVARAKEEIEAEEKGQISKSSLSAMVEEAARRQEDPATRIEPGLENAPEHIRANAEQMEQATKNPVADMAPADILAMSDEEFGKLDVRKLNREQMMAAFQRKSRG